MICCKEKLYRSYIKRFFDIVFSSIAIVVLSPIMIVVAVLIWINQGKPILFRQERPGLYERIFILYKFRTMTSQTGKFGGLLSDSTRLTPLGKFLRSSSLDELPELFNIIKGDMSIVGPRPLLTKYLPYYKEDEVRRSHVRPGLTGLAQINGRNALSWDIRFQYDVLYVDNISFQLDLKIILKTVLKVIQRKDILVGEEHILKDLDVERSETNANTTKQNAN